MATRIRTCHSSHTELSAASLSARAWLVLPILLAACTDKASEADQLAARDSLGIQIIENHAPLWTETTSWRVAEQPSLQIGEGVDGNSVMQFAHITGVHQLANGSIAVVDSWAPAVAFFDSAGGLLGRTGRRGSGPGEFPPRAVLNSFTCGTDSVYVVVNQQISVFASPSHYVRSFSLNPIARVRACSRDWLVGQLPGGNWRTATGTFTDSIALAWYDLSGSRVSIVDTFPGMETVWTKSPEGGTAYSLRTFGRVLSVTALGTILATGFGDVFQIALRDTTGGLSSIWRVTGLEQFVGTEEIERFKDFVFNPWRGNEAERRELETELEAARGRRLPAFAELRFDRAGNLWARRYDHIDAVEFYDYSSFVRSIKRPVFDQPRRWAVLRADGRYLGEITTPAEFAVHEIGDDWILGVWRDELDIPYVRRYALIKPPS